MKNSEATNEAQIHKLVEDRVNAVRARDVNGAMSNIAPDILAFDVVNPLQYLGADAARKRAEQWFSSFQGPIGFEMRDLNITASDEVAFSHSLNHYTGTKLDGEKLDMWVRVTVCYHRIDGKWTITHQHDSAPFDVESGKASLDLKP